MKAYAPSFLCPSSAHFRSTAFCALPGGYPELAGLGQVLALLQLLLTGAASNQGVAVLIHAIPKVLADHTNAGATAALQLPVVHIAPLIQGSYKLVLLY